MRIDNGTVKVSMESPEQGNIKQIEFETEREKKAHDGVAKAVTVLMFLVGAFWYYALFRAASVLFPGSATGITILSSIFILCIFWVTFRSVDKTEYYGYYEKESE